jgi:hypothetical protein
MIWKYIKRHARNLNTCGAESVLYGSKLPQNCAAGIFDRGQRLAA